MKILLQNKVPRWPSFPEFVCYLLDAVSKGQVLDMHWTPITEFCTPCMFNFDIIAHTETLQARKFIKTYQELVSLTFSFLGRSRVRHLQGRAAGYFEARMEESW